MDTPRRLAFALAQAYQAWEREVIVTLPLVLTREDVADRAIRELIREGVPFSSDDICARVGRPYHPAAVGALFMRAVRSGRLEEVGRVQSTRVEARGRRIPLYVGVAS